jgi:hypothetical protein
VSETVESFIEFRDNFCFITGKNEFGKLNTEYPKKVNVPIVNMVDCLRSNPVFSSITSDRTFCGGGRRDEGPCSGDSGEFA